MNKIEFEAELIDSRDQTAYDAPMVAVLVVTDDTELPHARPWEVLKRYRVTLEEIEPELKACPHCGGEAEEDHGVNSFVVMCKDCKASTWAYANKKSAVEAWNNRYQPGYYDE